MRLLVISDTHGDIETVIEYIKRNIFMKFDYLIHLGDYVEDGEKIKQALDLEGFIVAGNGDYGSGYPGDRIIDISGKKIFMTHGHRYKLGYNLDTLIYKAMEVKADIILFGHTHVPLNIIQEGIFIMNPGSPTFPRGEGSEKTFGIMQIDEEVNTKIVIMDED